jgi:hypothetical protein
MFRKKILSKRRECIHFSLRREKLSRTSIIISRYAVCGYRQYALLSVSRIQYPALLVLLATRERESLSSGALRQTDSQKQTQVHTHTHKHTHTHTHKHTLTLTLTLLHTLTLTLTLTLTHSLSLTHTRTRTSDRDRDRHNAASE